MNSLDLELDFEDLDFDAIITGNSPDHFPDNLDLKSAIEEVGVGCNDDYSRQLIEQKKKREEYLQYKEQRRRESKEERLRAVLIEKRELEEQQKSDPTRNGLKQKFEEKPKKRRAKPLTRIDTNVSFNRNVSNECQNKRQVINTFGQQISINKKLKIDGTDSQNASFGFTTVLIRNLSNETNEFAINTLGETVGTVLSVCIALEQGVRKALVRFESPVDALLFQRKVNNYKLDTTFIKTSLIP